VYARKERILRGEEGKTNLGERENIETYRKCKN